MEKICSLSSPAHAAQPLQQSYSIQSDISLKKDWCILYNQKQTSEWHNVLD